MAELSLSHDVQRVLAAIRQAGGRPLLVGGCVRDALMGHPAPKDIDVEVYGMRDAGQLAQVLVAWNPDEVGKSFGVLKVRAGDADVDISLPRRERKIGPGHRGFSAETADLSYAEASARRYFTVNSVMRDPATGEVIDCHGGRADIAAGVLRHTSPAFAEDPLRVLRAVQFAARFGWRLAPGTARLCRLLHGSYAELPAERVWTEWQKMGTRGTDVTAGLRALAVSGWEDHFPQIASLHGVPQDPGWHPEGDVHVHSGLAGDQAARLCDEAGITGEGRAILVLAAIAHDFGTVTHTQRGGKRITSYGHAAGGVGPATRWLEGIGCPPGCIKRIVPLVREHMFFQGKPTKPAVRRLARRLDPVPLADLVVLCGADRAPPDRGRDDARPGVQAGLDQRAGSAGRGRVQRRGGRGRVARRADVTEKPDAAFHEAGKIVRLILGGNPTVTELLWLPIAVRDQASLGGDLIAIRTSLLSAKRVRLRAGHAVTVLTLRARARRRDSLGRTGIGPLPCSGRRGAVGRLKA